jgi:RNA polymerase sigma-70 factor (ECF subfamily)
MDELRTTAAIQGYLDRLAALPGDAPAEPVVRALIERAAARLEQLCAALLHRSYPRLARPPLNLRTNEMLSAVVERLLKAMRSVRPATVRQFFALTHRHMRWELNDLARRLDEEAPAAELRSSHAAAPEESAGSEVSATARRLLEAIEGLPEDEREVFDLVRIQGMTHAEAALVLGVAQKTIQRRLHRGLLLLTEKLGDLRPDLSAPREP